MHEGEILDIRQLSWIGPDANLQIGYLFLERITPDLCVADALVEIDDEQRHNWFLFSSHRRPACTRASSRSGTLLAEATSPSRDPLVTESAATAASFSLIFAMIASLARSKTPRLVATKCCDWCSPLR